MVSKTKGKQFRGPVVEKGSSCDVGRSRDRLKPRAVNAASGAGKRNQKIRGLTVLRVQSEYTVVSKGGDSPKKEGSRCARWRPRQWRRGACPRKKRGTEGTDQM